MVHWGVRSLLRRIAFSRWAPCAVMGLSAVSLNMALSQKGSFDGILSGTRSGYGEFTAMDGTKTKGTWKRGKLQGEGRAETPDGAVYEGEFKDTNMHGQGKFTYPDKSWYEGEWKDNWQHGQGQFYGVDGECYEGEFRDGARSGRGFASFPRGHDNDEKWHKNSHEEYIGEWRADNRDGLGAATFADGTIFIGTFKDDRLLEDQGQFLKSSDLSEELDLCSENLCNIFHDKKIKEQRIARLQECANRADLVMRLMVSAEKKRPECKFLFDCVVEETKRNPPPQSLKASDPSALLAAAELAEGSFRRAVDDFLEEINVPRRNRYFGPPKQRDRLIEKLGSHKGELSLFDLNRVTIAFETDQQMHKLLLNIWTKFKVVKLKNKFNLNNPNEPPCIFYNVELREDQLPENLKQMLTSPRWVTEMQVTLPVFTNIQKKCHRAYEIRRVNQLPKYCPVCGGPPPLSG